MKEFTCRVAVVGAHKPRVEKVVSLLQSDVVLLQNESVKVTIHYLPCVASFGAYKDDSGIMVKYLSSLSYHGPEVSSLTPFFDEETDDMNPFPGIAAMAIGCGIETDTDIQQIESFIKALAGEKAASIIVDVVKPSQDFGSMKDETLAYQTLDASHKEQVTILQTMGPGKMAKFAVSLAHLTIETAYPKPVVPEVVIMDETSTETEQPRVPREFDNSTTRYACRMCRTILFDEGDIENPPHQPFKHNFGYHKYGSARCESLFLASGLDWMGDLSAVDGRFGCPSCSTKLGVWKWAGTQCSCGTWVVPAIQVPSSKVDVVLPVGESVTNPSILN